MKDINEFQKKREFLICIDSDGCAMDTMDIKHKKCFGPCMIREWGLESREDEILKRWNEINLYTMTRGINRFLGLSMALSEINDKYCRIDGIKALSDWAQNAKELSNNALLRLIEEGADPIFEKALRWSVEVNRAIDSLPESEKKPFEGVPEAIGYAHEKADVAIISSANKEAVFEEWSRCGFDSFVDVMCCQDVGSKAHCIACLKEMGYADDHVVMVGDAVGDRDAAEKNGVFFYPILVGSEAESWREFRETAVDKLIGRCYSEYEQYKKEQFVSNLNK